MSNKNKKEYYGILNEFDIPKYNDMKKDRHHGITRYEHSLRVAKQTYYLSKFFKGDHVSATRAAMMHDFFTSDDIDKHKWGRYLVKHPYVALKNAKEYFEVSEKEEQIIISHMFPFGKELPKSKEAWIVVTSDKLTSIYEFIRFGLIQGKFLIK